jgi:hypothetical protein
MPAKNDITGDKIQSKGLLKVTHEQWMKIFPEKRSARRWFKELYPNGRILDDDGFRDNDGVTLDTPITQAEFNKRIQHSTIQFSIS